MKAPLYYLHKKTQQVKLTFDMITRATKFITRADDRTKTIGNKNTKFLLNAIVEKIEENNGKPTHIDHDFISEYTDCLNDQNTILLKRLSDIFNAEPTRPTRFNGKRVGYGFIVSYTEDGRERLETPELFYDTNNELKQQKAKILKPIKIGHVTDKNRLSTYREKEIEDSSYRAISSISREKIKNKRFSEETKTSPAAALPFKGSSTGEFLSKTSKPRIVITAAMQNGTAQMPQASGLAKEEVSTTTSKTTRVSMPPVMTAEQERDHLRTHQTRKQETMSDEPKPIGTTILSLPWSSLIPKLNLEVNAALKAHQKRVEFQLIVENPKACSTLEPLVVTDLESNSKYQVSELETQIPTPEKTEDNKMAVLPYRDEEPDWAKDFKIQMTSDCQFEYEIDFWEYKAALKAMELMQNEDNKIVTLSGFNFDIKDLKKKRLKVFAARFYEVLPGYEFNFIENKQWQ